MQNDIYFKAAAGCFGLARNYMRKLTLEGMPPLHVRDYYDAVCEIVCFQLHLADRLIFEAAPNSREVRMDALLLATVRVLEEEIRADPAIQSATPVMPRRPIPSTVPPLPPEYGANNRVVTREQADAARAIIGAILDKYAQRWVENPDDTFENFRELYDARMEEYSGVGTDWFRLTMSGFGQHFAQAVNEGESMEIYIDAQAEAVRMHTALVEFAPELFKP